MTHREERAQTDVLIERGARYGSYSLNSRRFWKMFYEIDLEVISVDHPEQAYALLMVLVKSSRLAYKADDHDSWEDIIGYARLALGEYND